MGFRHDARDVEADAHPGKAVGAPRAADEGMAELRYLVLPERPSGTEGMSEKELAALVTRDSMVGVAKLTVNKTGGR